MNGFRIFGAAVFFSVAGLGVPLAQAHFELVSPANWANQDFFGSPQKSWPCGQADPSDPAMPTGVVTAVAMGSMLSVTIDERIYHPGHYRVSLAADQNGLPMDPPVQPGATACGSTIIDPIPALPVLADGILVHGSAFSTTQTFQVPLPPGMACTNCVLQVTEFMSDHPLNNPGGCFYHHCAYLTIADAGPHDAGSHDSGTPDAGAHDAGAHDAGADAGTPGMSNSVVLDGGTTLGQAAACGCSAEPALALFGLLGVGASLALRRRSDRRRSE